MKTEIHPQYHAVKATCICGNVIEIGSTLSGDMHLDIRSSRDSLYTGKQKTLDSGGGVKKFCQRFVRRTSYGS